jgi:hypothetical protein
MRKKEWLVSSDPQKMLHFLRGKASNRKLRLFAVACCRHLMRPWPSPPEYDKYLEWAELFADGEAGADDLAVVGGEVADYVEDYAPDWWTGIARGIACAVRLPAADPSGLRPATLQVLRYDRFPGEDRSGEEREEFAAQAALLRELVGRLPFRPVPIDPAWLTPAVIALAQGIYNERAFDRLPALADALEEAGCDNADILDHCRGPGPHVLGCWMLDLLLNEG